MLKNRARATGAAILLSLLCFSGGARAQDCGSITTTQYNQLLTRALKDKGSLTQGWCDFSTFNVTDCADTTKQLKHPGVDFGANLGTEVYAPVGGIVQDVVTGSDCTLSTCLSTLAIYNDKTGATYVFLHMKSILVKKGDEVVAGQQVGTVGQRGQATKPHLHYEVRSGVWIRAAKCVDGTINPFSNSPYLWDFNASNNFEGWARYNLESWMIADKILILNPASLDPYIVSPVIKADAATFKSVKLRMASNALDGKGCIYFKTEKSNSYTEDKKVCFTVSNCPLCTSASYKDYAINMASNSLWSGVISGIRLDPANAGKSGSSSDAVGIQYIMLSK
jgi:hypothetical protein